MGSWKNSVQRPVGKEDPVKYVGIDLHKKDVVVAVEDEHGPVGKPQRFACKDEAAMVEFFVKLGVFRAVIEASASYRWLYELLSPQGKVILAHPLRLRAIVTARAKTDKLDAATLAMLLRLGMIPEAYIPPRAYQELRELTRTRARVSRAATDAKCQLHSILASANMHPPFRNCFGVRGRRWLKQCELGVAGKIARDELLLRLEHYEREVKKLDVHLTKMAEGFPEEEALRVLHGIAQFSALLIVAELGEVERFENARQVGAYAGLTARVHQSGGHDYHGKITKQGSPWLRWILVQAAMKIVQRDPALRNLHTRIRKRSGKKIARVAVARKLAGICWIRLRRWHREHRLHESAASH
jgi:transposase